MPSNAIDVETGDSAVDLICTERRNASFPR